MCYRQLLVGRIQAGVLLAPGGALKSLECGVAASSLQGGVVSARGVESGEITMLGDLWRWVLDCALHIQEHTIMVSIILANRHGRCYPSRFHGPGIATITQGLRSYMDSRMSLELETQQSCHRKWVAPNSMVHSLESFEVGLPPFFMTQPSTCSAPEPESILPELAGTARSRIV
jgi:hypothetical protein